MGGTSLCKISTYGLFHVIGEKYISPPEAGLYESSGGPISSEISSEISLEISSEISSEISHEVGLPGLPFHLKFHLKFHMKTALQSFRRVAIVWLLSSNLVSKNYRLAQSI